MPDRPVRVHVLVNEGAGSVDPAGAAEAGAGGGSGADGGLAQEIVEAFDAVGAHAEVSVVDPGDLGVVMPRIWDGTDRPDAIVVAGGDGSVNAAANVAAGTDLVLGVLPLGTFNHFAKDLGLPDDLRAAAAALAAGAVRAVDVGEVGDRVFVNNSVLGAYPTMVAERDRLIDRRGWGKVRAVPVAVFNVLRELPIHRLDLVGSEGFERRSVRTPFVFVGNGRYDNEGGGLAERDGLTGGRLGLAVARAVSRWGLVRVAIRAVLRGADEASGVDRVDVTTLAVTGRVDRLRVAVDGEIAWFDLPLRYRIRPGALRVLAPAPCPSTSGASS